MSGNNMQQENAPCRKEFLKLWQLFLAVIMSHAIVVIALSPRLFRKEDTTPGGLLDKARGLAAEEKYEEAFELYQQMLLQKPQLPAIFAEAEKEMGTVRLRALEAQRRSAAALQAAEKADEDEGPRKAAPAEAGRAGPEPGPPEAPEVSLPSLPDIGGDL